MIVPKATDRMEKEPGVLQTSQPSNRYRRLLSFKDFVANRVELGYPRRVNLVKPFAESVVGNFENHQILDAIYCRMASNSNDAEKQIVASEIAEKLVAMSQLGDVVLLAVSVS